LPYRFCLKLFFNSRSDAPRLNLLTRPSASRSCRLKLGQKSRARSGLAPSGAETRARI
jgi:hypothetical protein